MASTTEEDEDEKPLNFLRTRLLFKRNSDRTGKDNDDDDDDDDDGGWPARSFSALRDQQLIYTTDEDFSETQDLQRKMSKQQSSESFASEFIIAEEDFDLIDREPGTNRERLPSGWSFQILRWPLLVRIISSPLN
jgi:hypothetical protein